MAEEQLNNAQVLGGVAVEFSSDLNKLKAGIAEAKQLVAQAERELRISVPAQLARAGAQSASAIGTATSAIATDLNKVKASMGEVKQIVSQTAKDLKITVPVKIDTADAQARIDKIKGEITQLQSLGVSGGAVGAAIKGKQELLARIQAEAGITPSGPLRIVSRGAEEQEIRDRMAGQIRAMRAQAKDARIEAAVKTRLVGPDGQEQSAKEIRAGIERELGEIEGRRTIGHYGYGDRIGRGRGTVASASKPRRAARRRQWRRRGLQLGVAAYFASRVARTGGEVYQARRMMRSSDAVERDRGTLAMISAGESFPVIGSLVTAADSFAGARSAIGRNIASAGEAEAAIEGAKRSLLSLRGRISALQGDMVGAAQADIDAQIRNMKMDVAPAEIRGRKTLQPMQKDMGWRYWVPGQALGEWVADKTFTDAPVISRSPEAIRAVEDTRTEGELRMRQFMRDRRITSRAHDLMIGGVGHQIASTTATREGRGMDALAESIEAERQSMRARHTARFGGVSDTQEIERIREQNAKEAELFEVNAADRVAKEKKRREQDVLDARATAAESSLRIAKQHYAADLAAFDAATRAKIASLDDLEAKRNERERRAAQRAQLVARQQEQQELTIGGFRAAAEVATLRADRRHDQAALRTFDEETKQRRAGVDASQLAEFDSSRATERSALVRTMAERRFDTMERLRAREGQALAISSGRSLHAQAIGTIAGMAEEMRNADPEMQPRLARTQRAEIGAMKEGIVNPRRYATEWDPFREARGGASGDAGSDELETLKVMAEYLKKIAEHTGRTDSEMVLR